MGESKGHGHLFKLGLAAIFLLALLLHFIAFLLEDTSPDMETWLITAKAVMSRQDFYEVTSPPSWHLPYVYPPLWAVTLGALAAFIDPYSKPVLYLFSVRNVLMVGNFVVGLVLLKLSGYKLAYLAFWILNPFVIGVAQSGQFDVIPTLLVLIAYLCHKNGRYTLAGLFIGLGFSFKFWPIFLLPLFIADYKLNKMRSSKAFIISALVASAAISVPFMITTQYFEVSSSSAGGSWYILVFALASMGAVAYYDQLPLRSSLTMAVALLLVILPNHIQYSLWIFPFLILNMVARPSVPLILLMNVLWVSHTLQRYAHTINEWTIISIQVPTIFLDVLFLLIMAWCYINGREEARSIHHSYV